MKIQTFLLAGMASLLISNTCLAIEDASQICQSQGMIQGTSIFGEATCRAGDVKALSIFGNASLKGTKVENALTVHGKLYADKVDLHGLTAYGKTSIKNSVIHDTVDIHGRLSVDHVKLKGAVRSFGTTKAKSAHFAGSVDVYGSLQAEESFFVKPITLTGYSLKMKKSKAKVISFIETDNHDSYNICLSDHSQVTGDIIFKGNQEGTVYLSKDSKITGSVKNGKIVRSSQCHSD